MKPIVHGLERKYGGCVEFIYLDTDNPASQDAMRRFGARGQPEFRMLDRAGKVIWTTYYTTEAELEAQLRAAVALP